MDDIYLYILYIVYVGSADGKEEKRWEKMMLWRMSRWMLRRRSW